MLGREGDEVLKVLDITFMCLYCVEFAIKIAGLGVWGRRESYFGWWQQKLHTKSKHGQKKGFVRTDAEVLGRKPRLNWWNIMDFIVMVSGFTSLVQLAVYGSNAEGGSALSSLRAFRLLRPLKAVNALPEMRILMRSILKSLPQLLNMLILFSLFLI